MKPKPLSLFLVLPLLATGCASIMDGGSKTVQISSNPPCKVSIFDKKGKEIYSQDTPTIVSLKRQHGYLSGEDYKLVFEAPGYYPSEYHVKSVINGWYFGNIIFGGLIGIVLIDPATGAEFTLSPREVSLNLVPGTDPALTMEQFQTEEKRLNPPRKTQVAQSGKGTAK